MIQKFNYQIFIESFNRQEISGLGPGYSLEGAKRLAFGLIWLKFQFGWRLGRLEEGIPLRFRIWIYLGVLICLACMVLFPFLSDSSIATQQIPHMAITLPQIPREPDLAPDTLLNYVSLNPLCNDEPPQ